MSVKEAKSDPVFILEDLINAKQQIVHAKRSILYPTTQILIIASEELRVQAERYDKTYKTPRRNYCNT